MSNNYSMKWDLSSLNENRFPGLTEALKTLQSDCEALAMQSSLPSFIAEIQNLGARCQEFENLIHAFLSQDVNDQTAVQLQAQAAGVRSALETHFSHLNAKLALLSEEEFKTLIENPLLEPIAFNLREKRNWSHEQLPLEEEKIVNSLSINGYQAWNDLYSTLMGRLSIPLNEGPEVKKVSVGQAENFLSHPDRTVRQAMFKECEKTWKEHENTFGLILNNLSGFRLQLYQARKWSSFIKEPLHCNRMQEKTLDTMWEVVERRKELLKTYLAKKAKLLNLPKLSWFDIDSPLHQVTHPFLSFQEAAVLIISEFKAFSPHMGAFAEKAFQEKWIEAEDREGKRPGGYCAHFPMSRQSRIFMTYSGSMTNLFTLAHELGHAYHNFVVDPLPRLSQDYKMNVAETASTLAEAIIIDALIKNAPNDQIKKVLLDYKIQRAVMFCMNIHARFLFEKSFYEERMKGFVLPSALNQLMENAQKKAFCDALGEWNPYFWVSKQHFYFTEVPFYNFPYTFGYLFSLGVYTDLRQKGPDAYLSYDALLADTGRMATEELAQKHLSVNLQEPHFWEMTIGTIEKDIEELLSLM
jgi:pepF/M3 family oligoendopeptidase